MFKLLLQELRERRNAILGWGISLCFFPIIYVGLYPSFADQLAGLEEMMDLAIYQAMGITMASFEGYVASTVTNIVPVVLCIFAVLNGTGTLAGEEDDGRLELITALPIPRWQIVTVKAIALAIALLLILVIISAGSALILASISTQISTDVTPLDMFWALMQAWPLVSAVGMVSLFLGAFSPNRRTAAMIATIFVVVSYFGSNLAGMVASIDWMQNIFLFYYYEATGEALQNGQTVANMLIVSAVTLAAFGLAVLFFQRRDITVGVWPWQKGKLPTSAT